MVGCMKTPQDFFVASFVTRTGGEVMLPGHFGGPEKYVGMLNTELSV